MTRRRRNFWILASATIGILGLYFGAGWVLLSILVTPNPKLVQQGPTELGFRGVEVVSFKSTADETVLHGWFVPSEGDRAIILTHGIHSHAWDCGQPDLARAYQQAGFAVLLFDARGHGRSGGGHVGLGLLERGDVRAAVDVLLMKGFKSGRIGIHGSSYGAGVAILAAAAIDEIGAVISDSAFASIRDVIGGEICRQTGLPAGFAKILMPGLRLLSLTVYSLDINDAGPEKAIGRISPRSILLIHGREDSVIPYEHALRLREAVGPTAELWLIPGDHTEGVRRAPDCEKVSPVRDEYLNKIVEFFDRHLGAVSRVT